MGNSATPAGDAAHARIMEVRRAHYWRRSVRLFRARAREWRFSDGFVRWPVSHLAYRVMAVVECGWYYMFECN